MTYTNRCKHEKKKDHRNRSEMKFSWIQTLTGSLFLICGFFLLSWNELTAIETNRSLAYALEDLRIITNIWKIDKANDGYLVYVTGLLQVGEPLTELDYGISVPAVMLKRRVQMYQWVEQITSPRLSGMKEDSLEGSTQYSYFTSWKDKLIDSSKFHLQHGHHNPKKFSLKSHQYISSTVKVGSFILATELKWKFSDFTLITSDERPERKDIKMHAGLYYHTADVWDPHVGDLRIQFSYAGMSADIVSIIAKQRGEFLSGDDILFLEKGRVSPDDMLKNHHNKNIWTIHICRCISWLLLYIAASCLASMLQLFAVKFRRLFQFIILDGFLSSTVAFSAALFAVIVSSIWLTYKPWISASIILGFCTPGIISLIYKQLRSSDNIYHLVLKKLFIFAQK